MLIIAVAIPKVFADDYVSIHWPEHGYLFRIDNAVPGDVFTRTFTINTRKSDNRYYYFRIQIVTDEHSLSKALQIKVIQSNKILYEGSLKNLADKPNGTSLNITGNKRDQHIDVSIVFDRNAGNIYQKSAISFYAEVGALRAMPVHKIEYEQKTHKKHESIWEMCTRYIKKVENKFKKVGDRPR